MPAKNGRTGGSKKPFRDGQYCGYRIIFVLHDIEGYEHNEIAEMLGCSVGNSKSQLHKARTKLRDVLKITRAENARNNNMNVRRPVTVGTERGARAAATAA